MSVPTAAKEVISHECPVTCELLRKVHVHKHVFVFGGTLQEDPEFPKLTLRSKLMYLLNVHLCLIFLFRHLILISQGPTAQSGKHHILPQSNRWAALTPSTLPVSIFFFHHAHESFLEDILLGWSWSFPPTLSQVTILPKPPYVLAGRPAL